MDDLLRAMCRDEGAFLRRDAIALGYDDTVIAQRVRAGIWVRIRHGAYTFADLWAGFDAATRHRVRAHAVTRAARAPHVLSHTTSVLHHTTAHWGLDLADVHVTRLDGHAGRAMSGVRQHHGEIGPGDIVRVNGALVTSPTRSALELTTVTDVERSLIVMDDFLRRRKTTHAEMAAMCRRMTYWPDTLATDLAIRLSDGRAESAGETRFRYLCWRAGFPAPKLQYEIRDPSGRVVARVDFAWPELGLFVEFDGLLKYSSGLDGLTPAEVVVREKRREDLIRRLTGWRCLRLVWADLERPDETIALVRRVLWADRPDIVA